MSQQKIMPLAPLLMTAFLLFFGFTVLVIGIDSMHMRPDEELTFRNMSFNFHESITRLATRNNQAPLWWIQVWLWQRLAGTSEFAGRVNSVLWSMMTLAVSFEIGRSWFGDRHFGWFSILLLSVNSYFFIYALEMRMYASGMVLVALSMRFFHAWIYKKIAKLAIVYGLSVAAMLYTHYYLGFIVLAQAVYFFIFHLLDWRLVKQGFAAAAVAFLAWFPGIIVLYNQLVFISFVDSGGLSIPTKASSFETIYELAQLSSNGMSLLFGLLFVLGLVVLWQNVGCRLALGWLFISTGLVFAINTQAPIYNVRYTSFMIPSVPILLAAAIGSIPALLTIGNSRKSGEYKGSPLHRSSLIQIAILTLISAISLYNLPNYIPDRVPFRHLFANISNEYEEGDVLLVYHQRPDLFLDDQFVRYLPDGLLDNEVDSVEEARDYRRVWYLTDYIFNEDSQAIFEELEDSHRQQLVIGQCPAHSWCYIARLMEAPPLREPIFFGDTLGFLGADVSPIENNQLGVLLWWMVEDIPEADYSISLQLIAPDGSLVAQVDRQIDPPEEAIGEIPTSAMQPEGDYIDGRVLELPANLANGDYRLQLIVYQWWNGVRLQLDDGRDVLELEVVNIDQ